MSKHVCPKCGHNAFYTTAHICEEWLVDEHGNCIRSIGCVDVDDGPDDENIWSCARCGEEGIIIGDDEKFIPENPIEEIPEDSDVFDMILLEKPVGYGITPAEVLSIIHAFPEGTELIPIEIESKYADGSSAMGFITIEADEKIHSIENPIDVEDRVGNVLSDVTLEKENGIYEYSGIRFYLARELNLGKEPYAF